MEILHKLKSGPACNIPSWVSAKMLYGTERLLIHVQIAICILKLHTSFSLFGLICINIVTNKNHIVRNYPFKVNFDFIDSLFLKKKKYVESHAAGPEH